LYVNLPYHGKALNSLICADVPLRNYSLNHYSAGIASGGYLYHCISAEQNLRTEENVVVSEYVQLSSKLNF